MGVHEFIDWCDTVGTKPMLAINWGRAASMQARNFVEYVNGPTGSYWAISARRTAAPSVDVRLWCLGNEMDGPWQVGMKTAAEYGRLASETAKALRAFDKSLGLVVCGSSHSDMVTYPEWEREVLEHTYDSVDHISLHMYFNNRANHTANYLAMNAKLDRYIGTVAGDDQLCEDQDAQQEGRHHLVRRVERLVPLQQGGQRSPRRQQRPGRMPRACSKTSTISRTCCRSAASSTPSSAARTACASPASRSSSTSSRRS